MKTRGEVIKEYKEALSNGTEGVRLLETFKSLSSLNCTDKVKAQCLKEEIDHIICGYIGKTLLIKVKPFFEENKKNLE